MRVCKKNEGSDRSRLIAISLVAILLFSGCPTITEYHSFGDPGIEEGDEPPAVQFKRTLGRKWYGIDYLGVKVGGGWSTRRIRRGSDGDVFRLQWSETMHLQIFGKANVVKISGEKEFEGRPPYTLLSCKLKEKSGKYSREVRIFKESWGYEASVMLDGGSKSPVRRNFQYTLADELTLEMWARTGPKMEDEIPFRYFGDDMLEIIDSHAYIREISRESVNGKTYTFYEMMERQESRDLSIFNYREDGVPRWMKQGVFSRSEAENKKNALEMDPDVDLYVRAIVQVDRKIGKSSTLQHVRLALEGLDFDLLDAAPGQVVEKEEEEDRVVITLDPLGSPRIKATPREIERFSKYPASRSSDFPEIAELAQQAIGDAEDRGAQIDKLARFVEKYIEFEYVFTANLRDIVENKKGDCTEYATLFNALARSVGIPSRDVGGLVYIGDWCKGFGMHAWNEVVIDGHWTSVDASVGASSIDPVYIRFPDNEYKESRIISSIPDMEIKVIKVDKKK
ncbi:MAG: transglutaminase domain-containing protein [Desulfobacterales bacterium]|nr:transglutaminase domain-containing protein [Desulfobacterales bacterium]